MSYTRITYNVANVQFDSDSYTRLTFDSADVSFEAIETFDTSKTGAINRHPVNSFAINTMRTIPSTFAGGVFLTLKQIVGVQSDADDFLLLKQNVKHKADEQNVLVFKQSTGIQMDDEFDFLEIRQNVLMRSTSTGISDLRFLTIKQNVQYKTDSIDAVKLRQRVEEA